jgi:hypothetical protein
MIRSERERLQHFLPGPGKLRRRATLERVALQFALAVAGAGILFAAATIWFTMREFGWIRERAEI